jgi:hypothetical protein
MKKTILFFVCLLTLISIGTAQTFLDTANNPAILNAYQLDVAPTIDGMESGWDTIPWTELYFNDHDWNADSFQDPLPDKRDLMARYKAAWMEGSSELFLIIESRDNELVTTGDKMDGFVVSIDPLNEKTAGAPGNGAAYAITFPAGAVEHSAFLGATEPVYRSATAVNSELFPSKATLELAISLPAGVAMTNGTKMGFYLQVDDIDTDLGYNELEHTLVPWPPLFKDGERILPRSSKDDVSKWGELELAGKPVHIAIAAGESIQSAIDDAVPGLTVINVAGGTFAEILTIESSGIYLTGSMDEANPTILINEDRFLPAINVTWEAMGTVIENMTIGSFNGDSSTTEGYAQGILIEGRDTKLRKCKGLWLADPVKVVAAEACIIEDNFIQMMGQAGDETKSDLQFNGTGIGNTVCRYNFIARGWVNGASGIEAKDLYGVMCLDIGFNTVSDCRESQIEISTVSESQAIDAGGELDVVVTVHHNILYNTIQQMEWANSGQWSWAGQGGPDDAIELKMFAPSTAFVYNNTANRNRGEFLEHNNDADTICRNNIATNSYSQEDYDFRGTLEPDVDFSLSFGNSKPEIIMDIASGPFSAIDDPLYVDADNDDYALSAGSPAIDAGELNAIDFQLFFAGDAPDVGAIEYGVADFETSVNKRAEKKIFATDFVLHQNYPNPFNPSTSISYELVKDENVQIDIYDINGRLVHKLVNQAQTAGLHQASWDARGAPSGVYFYSLTIGNQRTMSKKMMLIK